MTRRAVFLALLTVGILGELVLSIVSAPRSGAVVLPGSAGAADWIQPQSGAPSNADGRAAAELEAVPMGDRTGLGAPTTTSPGDPDPSGSPRAIAARRASPTARPPAATPKVDASACSTPCFVDVGYLVRKGLASNYGPRYSEWWVALPDGPGWRFRVCGPAACRVLVSTDAGPSKAMQRPPYNRVVDLPIRAFEAVCGVPWRMGLCPVEVTILGRTRR